MLDTNIWSEIGRRDSRPDLEKLALARRWKLQTPPATLLEVLRTPDEAALGKILDVLSSKHWVRLRTEADREAAEVVGEARRLRPGWLRQIPQPGRIDSLRTFWQKKIWREARHNAMLVRETSDAVHSPAHAGAYRDYKENRDSRLASQTDVSDLRHMVVEPEEWSDPRYLAGWRAGQRVEWWRVHGRDVFLHAIRTAVLTRMSGRDSTYTDWLEPYLDLSSVLADPADFTAFWFDHVDESAMPRIWLRWAVYTAQLMGRVTPSSSGDEQLSAYLPDCDVFVTADKRLAKALDLVGEHSRFTLPHVVRFPRLADSDSAVEVLGDAVV